MERGKEMAAEQEHGHSQRRSEEQAEIPADRRRDAGIVQPASQDREGQHEELEEIQPRSPSHSAGEGEKRLQSHRLEDGGDQDQRKGKKPFDPIFKDEFIGALEDVQRRIMAHLVDHFRGRVQQKEQQ